MKHILHNGTLLSVAFTIYKYLFLLILGYIDLSKRRVGPEDIIKCTEKFSNAKHVSLL